MRVSFPSDRWPAVGIIAHDGILRYVLKDGKEIKREELTILCEANNEQAHTEDGRPMYAGLPNGELLGPPRGSQELTYITEDDKLR